MAKLLELVGLRENENPAAANQNTRSSCLFILVANLPEMFVVKTLYNETLCWYY